MSKLEEIESAVKELDETEYSRFRQWLADYDNAMWDKQIEEDVKAGRLDKLIAEADEELKQGRTIPLDEVLDNI